jgi:hypothetical protein
MSSHKVRYPCSYTFSSVLTLLKLCTPISGTTRDDSIAVLEAVESYLLGQRCDSPAEDAVDVKAVLSGSRALWLIFMPTDDASGCIGAA